MVRPIGRVVPGGVTFDAEGLVDRPPDPDHDHTTGYLEQSFGDHGWSKSLGAINVALCDASCRTVASGISQVTWQYAITPNDNNPLPSDWQ